MHVMILRWLYSNCVLLQSFRAYVQLKEGEWGGCNKWASASLKPQQWWLDMPANRAFWRLIKWEMLGQISHHHKIIVWNRQSGPSEQCTVFMRRGERNPKLVELEHLPNWEIPWFSRSTQPEGCRKRVECACAALCIVTYRNITEHPSPLIDTGNPCTDTRWTIALLHNTCDIDMSDQWLTALMGLYQRIKCKQGQLFLLPFFPFQPCRVKIGYYHSPRKALQNKVPRPANPTDFLCSKF